jgi:hypothetical protein
VDLGEESRGWSRWEGGERMNLTDIAPGVYWECHERGGTLMVVLEEKGEENSGGGRS